MEMSGCGRRAAVSETILERAAPAAHVRRRYGAATSQFGELRLPEGVGPHPCAIFIHGGFWRARYDVSHSGHLCAALAAAGVATWSIEYRRVGEAGGGWPGTFHDVVSAAADLFAFAPEYDIDPTRVIAVGHSAGGHLAAWLGGLGRVPTTSPIHAGPLPRPLRGVATLAGVLDLERAWALGLSGGAVADLLGGGPGEVPERYAAASPRALLPLGVPQLIVHGTADASVPYAIGADYHAAAAAAGDAATLLSLPRAGHFDLIDPDSAAWPAIQGALIESVAEPDSF